MTEAEVIKWMTEEAESPVTETFTLSEYCGIFGYISLSVQAGNQSPTLISIYQKMREKLASLQEEYVKGEWPSIIGDDV